VSTAFERERGSRASTRARPSPKNINDADVPPAGRALREVRVSFHHGRCRSSAHRTTASPRLNDSLPEDRMAARGGGFDRWTQQLAEIVELVFRMELRALVARLQADLSRFGDRWAKRQPRAKGRPQTLWHALRSYKLTSRGFCVHRWVLPCGTSVLITWLGPSRA
jgi:hypothetical protein